MERQRVHSTAAFMYPRTAGQGANGLVSEAAIELELCPGRNLMLDLAAAALGHRVAAGIATKASKSRTTAKTRLRGLLAEADAW